MKNFTITLILSSCLVTSAFAQENHSHTLDANGKQAGHATSAKDARAASKHKGAQAPAFSTVDSEGKTVSLKDLTGKPTLIVFIEKGCPCCKSGKPYYDRIQNHYGDVANVVGIVAGTQADAAGWKAKTVPQFRVVADPGAKIATSLHAKAGLYTVLLSPSGRVEKTYAGYSQSMLREVTSKIAKFAKVADRKMEVLPAPKELTSGCEFAEHAN